MTRSNHDTKPMALLSRTTLPLGSVEDAAKTDDSTENAGSTRTTLRMGRPTMDRETETAQQPTPNPMYPAHTVVDGPLFVTPVEPEGISLEGVATVVGTPENEKPFVTSPEYTTDPIPRHIPYVDMSDSPAARIMRRLKPAEFPRSVKTTTTDGELAAHYMNDELHASTRQETPEFHPSVMVSPSVGQPAILAAAVAAQEAAERRAPTVTNRPAIVLRTHEPSEQTWSPAIGTAPPSWENESLKTEDAPRASTRSPLRRRAALVRVGVAVISVVAVAVVVVALVMALSKPSSSPGSAEQEMSSPLLPPDTTVLATPHAAESKAMLSTSVPTKAAPILSAMDPMKIAAPPPLPSVTVPRPRPTAAQTREPALVAPRTTATAPVTTTGRVMENDPL